MRRVKLQMQISIDGFVSTGPNDDQQWVTWDFESISGYVTGILENADSILIGRKLAVNYIPYWEDVYTQPDHEMYVVAKHIAPAKKYLFTKTLSKAEWPNTELVKNDLATEVKKLKNQPGKDIMVYGGSSFVNALIKEKLVDEFHLFINPVALGHGERIFEGMQQFMTLKNSIVYNSGIVLLHYEPR